MRILFDHNTPRQLRVHLAEHTTDTAREKGWAEISNGRLLYLAEREGYDILITADQSMRHQQNFTRRQVSVIVLLSNRWLDVREKVTDILATIEGIQPGEVREVQIPPTET